MNIVKEGRTVPRKGHTQKRDVLADPIYNNKVVTKLINNIMLDGKRGVAQKIVYGAFDRVAAKTERPAIEVFEEAMNNICLLYTSLEGPTAIAICATDATAPARILSNFAKTAEALELKCGVVEGTYYDAAGIQTIASIPSRDELLSKFLGSIQSPITNFARVIKQIAEKNEEVA